LHWCCQSYALIPSRLWRIFRCLSRLSYQSPLGCWPSLSWLKVCCSADWSHFDAFRSRESFALARSVYARVLSTALPSFPWYYAPISFVGGLIVWIGFEHLVVQFVRNQQLVAALSVSAAAILGLVTIGLSQPADALPATHAHEQAGSWLHDHAQPGQTVAAYETGTVAYLSDLTTIDILGLTEPRALPFVQRGDYGWAVRLAPDYIFVVQEGSWPVVRAIYDEPAFQRDYRLVARFANAPGPDYLLYQRMAAV
jgi:hypothetical protein